MIQSFKNFIVEDLDEAVKKPGKVYPFDTIATPKSVKFIDCEFGEFNGKKYVSYANLDADFFYMELQVKEERGTLVPKVRGKFEPGPWYSFNEAIDILGIDVKSLDNIVITKPKFAKMFKKFMEQREFFNAMDDLNYNK